jgi:hypothetical protein
VLRVKQCQTALYCLLLVLSSLLLGSCAFKTVPQTANGQTIESLGFNAISVHPVFKAYLRLRPSNDAVMARTLSIYIEGDGASWLFKTIPPRNPTPDKSLVVAMAASDPNPYVLYLARPCQFIDLRIVKECDESLWTDGRFSAQVITLFNQAIDEILRSMPPLRLHLVGHSGGGTLATLIAAQRSDVNCLVTLASPLDISAWTQALAIAPLLKSQNPAKPNANLKQIRQTHFFGERDTIVTTESIGHYRNFPPQTAFITISGFDHQKFWVEHWPMLQKQSCLTH